MNYLLIFIGGGLGALSRFTLTKLITDWFNIRFPIGILTCNLLGCLLIGYLVGYTAALKNTPEWFGPFLIVGFLGGFTTFSTFANDSYNLVTQGQAMLGFFNILLSIVPALFAIWLGLRLAGS